VSIRERRALRNHLESVHAIALANLAEVASGLATLAGLPPRLRGIVTGLSVSYVKKARGHLTAECNSAVPELTEPADHEADVVVRDERGDVVVQARACWRLSPTGAARDGRAGVRARRGTMRSV
jgi:acyl-coenzyme A thioesterase PaaI-like protein